MPLEMKQLQQHSAGISRHQSHSVKQQWAAHPKGKLVWGNIKHGAVAIPLIFTTFSTDLAKHTLLSRMWTVKLFNLLLDSLTKIISRSEEKQGNCKTLQRHQDVHKTQQELKPRKAEVSKAPAAPAFCSCCLSTHLLCVTALPSVPPQSSTTANLNRLQLSLASPPSSIFCPYQTHPTLMDYTLLHHNDKNCFIVIFLNCLWKNVYAASHSMREVWVFPVFSGRWQCSAQKLLS